MKFLVDMALSPRTVHFLREMGYEAVRANEVGMAKAKDVEIMEYAAEHDFLLLLPTSTSERYWPSPGVRNHL